VVGDTLETDIAGAKNIGIKAIWLNCNHKEVETAFKPDDIINDVTELPDTIRRLQI
jgi:FMN phosphatase YigB (HAD superfamily)